MLYRNSVKWRLGRGWLGAENSVPSAVLSKQQSLAAIGYHGTPFLSSTNFILPLKRLIGFHLIKLVGMLKCVNISLEW